MVTIEEVSDLHDIDLAKLTREFDLDYMVERERRAGVRCGPFEQKWLLERAPHKVKEDFRKLKKFPHIYGMPFQTFSGLDAWEFQSANIKTINTTTTETNLWDPALFAPIPANTSRPGKIYEVMFGGVMGTTATPTIDWRARYGTNNSAPPTGTDLGLGPTVTLGIFTAQPFYGEFTFGVRSIGIAASTMAATGNGWVVMPAAAAATVTPHAVFGGALPTTLDSTIAQALGVSIIWGASSISNTLTCAWVVFRSLN